MSAPKAMSSQPTSLWLSSRARASLPDVVVCVVLIVCGVWLVKGPHPAKKPDASKDVPEDADFCEYHADEPDNAALLSSPVVNENEVTDDGTEHDE